MKSRRDQPKLCNSKRNCIRVSRPVPESPVIHVIEAWNAADHEDLLQQMYQMRARVFGERMKWDIKCSSGKESDELDRHHPLYVISCDERGFVNGSCRLLPTTGPTLIDTVFSDTISDVDKLNDPSIWECTRFCVEESQKSQQSRGVSRITLQLIRAVLKIAVDNGVETILANINSTTLRIARRVGYQVDLLGVSERFDPPVYLGSFSVSQGVTLVDRMDLQPRRKRSSSAPNFVEHESGAPQFWKKVS